MLKSAAAAPAARDAFFRRTLSDGPPELNIRRETAFKCRKNGKEGEIRMIRDIKSCKIPEADVKKKLKKRRLDLAGLQQTIKKEKLQTDSKQRIRFTNYVSRWFVVFPFLGKSNLLYS